MVRASCSYSVVNVVFNSLCLDKNTTDNVGPLMSSSLWFLHSISTWFVKWFILWFCFSCSFFFLFNDNWYNTIDAVWSSSYKLYFVGCSNKWMNINWEIKQERDLWKPLPLQWKPISVSLLDKNIPIVCHNYDLIMT